MTLNKDKPNRKKQTKKNNKSPLKNNTTKKLRKYNKSKSTKKPSTSNKSKTQSFIYSSSSSYSNINGKEQYHTSGKQAQNQNGDMSGFKWKQKDNKEMNKKKLTRKELEQMFKFNGNRNREPKPIYPEFLQNIGNIFP